MTEIKETRQYDECIANILEDAAAVGKAAADDVALRIQRILDCHGTARIIFATGASQFSFLEALIEKPLDWSRIHAFHLDEYLGLPESHPASFRKYLRERLFDRVNPAQVHLLDGTAEDAGAECQRYARLLLEDEIHLACIGIGENGHIAFNDPPVADFQDSHWVKVVELDAACRQQQLGEGWFPTLDDVPTHALTLTIPAIMRSQAISCVAPDERKSDAVQRALLGPIETACPASILRQHGNATLWLDQDAASKLQ